MEAQQVKTIKSTLGQPLCFDGASATAATTIDDSFDLPTLSSILFSTLALQRLSFKGSQLSAVASTSS
jgi:hypothetical protein